MAFQAPRRRPRAQPTPRQPGPVTPDQIAHALARAGDDELRFIDAAARDNLDRAKTLTAAVEAEIERRHWPGSMTAAA
jgi:hypothetical protein